MTDLHRAAKDSLWLVPTACVAAALALAAATLALDRGPAEGLVPGSWTGSATSAQQVLSTVASSMLSLVTVVLTVLTLALQFAMQQFSPRIVRSLLQDRPSQLSHGLFAGTFVFCVLALRSVDEKQPVPTLTVLVAYLLVLASLVTLVLYVHHAGQSLRVASLIDLVGDNLRAELDAAYPPPPTGLQAPGVAVAGEPGAVTRLDIDALVAGARRSDCRLELAVAMGDFVPVGAPLLRCTCGASHQVQALTRHVTLSNERTHETDVAYGFRKLVDIAERSVASSPFNDPTTTVQAIDRLHDCLRQLATRDLDIGEHRDAEGRVRLVVPVPTWDGFVRLAFDEVRLAGAGSPQVARRLQAALEDLASVVPDERLPAIARQQDLLGVAVQDRYADDRDATAALTADAQGLGSGRDVVVRG